MDDFIVRAILGGIGVALISAPLGSIIIWKRMSFFGDALAHSALLGISLSLFLGISHFIGIIIVACLISLLINYLQKKNSHSNDTLLGIMSHSSLALGLVVVSFLRNPVNLSSFLFGDILTITRADICLIYGGCLLIGTVLGLLWHPLLLTIIDEDLAKIEGTKVNLIKVLFMLMISIFVAFSIKIVGLLLITSLLIIPPAAARPFSRTPNQMVILAGIFGIICIVCGMLLSINYDIASGAAIVVCALSLFLIASLKKSSF